MSRVWAEEKIAFDELQFFAVITTMHIVNKPGAIVDMTMNPKLTKLELQIMEIFWTRGELSIREIQEAFPERSRPAYTTVQTTVYRLEAKRALRRIRKVGNFHIFGAALSRRSAQKRLIDDLLGLFGGKSQVVMAHLIESGDLTLDNVREAEKILLDRAAKKSKSDGKDKS
ncbi:MAG: BlaI/MecI/CopY family transcriptional regulator [Acidobacteriaceae bacterium]